MLRKLSGAYSGTSCLRVSDRLVSIGDQRWRAIPTIAGGRPNDPPRYIIVDDWNDAHYMRKLHAD